MHPIHSDLVAGVVREERLRAAAARQVAAAGREAADDAATEPAHPLVRRALGWFRGAANIDLRHA